MTYIPEYLIESTQSQSTVGAPASIAAGQRMPCGSITHTGVNVNGNGQLELSAGYTYVIMGTCYIEKDSGTADIEVQWYDVTNSQWLGRAQKCWASTADQTLARTSVARALLTPSVTTVVEFRIVNVGAVSRVNTHVLADGYAGQAWYGVLSF